MMNFAQKLLESNIEDRKDYLEKYRELLQEVEDEAEISSENEPQIQREEITDTQNQMTERICPRCGAKLVLRTARKGNRAGQQFYGCTAFPKCRYVEQIES